MVAGAGGWWPSSGWLDCPDLGAEVAERADTSFVRWRLFLPERSALTLGRCAVGLLEGLGSPPSTLCMVRVELDDLLRPRLRVADPGRELLVALRRRPIH